MQKVWASQVALVVKNSPANAGGTRDVGLIPGLGRSPGGGNGNPLQNSCLENPMNRGAWWAAVQGGHKESDTTKTTYHTHMQKVQWFILWSSVYKSERSRLGKVKSIFRSNHHAIYLKYIQILFKNKK